MNLIINGQPIPKPGVPESFRVLVKELQALGLDMKVLDADKNEIELRDIDDDDDSVINVDAVAKLKEKEENKQAQDVMKQEEDRNPDERKDDNK